MLQWDWCLGLRGCGGCKNRKQTSKEEVRVKEEFFVCSEKAVMAALGALAGGKCTPEHAVKTDKGGK